MIAVLAAIVGALVVSVICALLLAREGSPGPNGQRWSLALLGGGMVGAAPGRFLGEPTGVFDLLMLVGLLGLLITLWRSRGV